MLKNIIVTHNISSQRGWGNREFNYVLISKESKMCSILLIYFSQVQLIKVLFTEKDILYEEQCSFQTAINNLLLNRLLQIKARQII